MGGGACAQQAGHRERRDRWACFRRKTSIRSLADLREVPRASGNHPLELHLVCVGCSIDEPPAERTRRQNDTTAQREQAHVTNL